MGNLRVKLIFHIGSDDTHTHLHSWGERTEYQEVLIELKHMKVLQVLISHIVNCEREVS